MIHRTTLTPDPQRLYWYRAHQRALRLVRRAQAAYERVWRSGAPAQSEWEQIHATDRRAAYCYRQLCRVMGWR